ncbi:MAG: hypothetical protein HY096_07350 [Nitrospinae bacterium]|nr:hypothetical protein [Nitrospinota bacterium]
MSNFNLKEKPLIALILISIFTSIFSAYFTCIQGDEGFYLYAVKTIKGSQTLYEDVNYCQFPGFPVIFSVISKVFGDNFYLLRLFSAIFGIGSFILGYLSCKYLGVSKKGLWIYALAISLNTYMIYFTTLIRPISTTAFFCSLSLYLILTERYKTNSGVFLILLFSWMAIWSRFTAFPILIIFHLFLIYYYRLNYKKQFLYILLSLALGFLFFGYYLIVAPEKFIFNNLTAHVLLYEGFYKSRTGQIIGKFRHLIGLSDKFFVIVLLIILLSTHFKEAFKKLLHHPKRESLLLTILAILGVFLIHLTPHRILREHFIIIIPVSTALIIFGVDRLYPKFNRYIIGILFLLIGLQFFSIRHHIPYFARENSLEKITFQKMLDISQKVSNYSKEGDMIITPEPEVAYYSRRDVIQGLGSGCFGCRSNMSDEIAIKYGYLNENLFLKSLDNDKVTVVSFEEGHWFFSDKFLQKLHIDFELIERVPYRDASKPYLIFIRK